MAVTRQPALGTEHRTTGYQGGLARTLIRTLLIFSLIPLILMATAAYFRARSLLQEQVVGQLQAQLKDQLARLDLAVKTKEIRLDRVTRGPGRSALFAAALQGGPGSQQLAGLQGSLMQDLRSIDSQTGRPVFNHFFLVDSTGTIRMASKPEWQNASIRDSALFAGLANKDQQSFVLYDAAPLFPNSLVLATVAQVKSGTGTPLGTLVGITQSDQLQSVLLALSSLNADSEALLVTESGKVIGTDPYTDQISPLALPPSQQLLIQNAVQDVAHNADAKPVAVRFTDNTGAAAFGQAAWLDSIGAGIVYEVHEQSIFGPLNSLIPFTIILVVITVLAMLVLLAAGTSRVFRPLADLAEVTNHFADGDFSQRAEAKTKDEIGMLAVSFNRMAQELSDLYRSLEQKVDERTRQIHTAAEVAQRITSTSDLNELLNRTVQLIVEQFDFYQASIFMLDQRGRYAVLQASYGPAAR